MINFNNKYHRKYLYLNNSHIKSKYIQVCYLLPLFTFKTLSFGDIYITIR